MSAVKEFKVCVSYNYDGKTSKELPFDLCSTEIDPVYDTFESWGEIDETLPETLDKYVKFIEEYLGIPVYMISIGPGREQLIDLAMGDLIA